MLARYVLAANVYKPLPVLQLSAEIIAGRRPPIPAPNELPGRASGSFKGLEDYFGLMQRCAGSRRAGHAV